MDERRLRIRVGIVVFAAVIVLVILVVLFGLKPQFLQPQYTIKIGFPRAPGVSRDTPVRKDGVPIGRVTDVMLREEGGVVLTMRIDEQRKLKMNERARISTGSLVTNDAVVEFVRDESDPNNQVLEDGDYLPNHGDVAGDPLEIMVQMEDDMTEAFTAIKQAGNSMSAAFTKIGNQLEEVLDEEQAKRIAASVENALNRFSDVMIAVEDVVGDPELVEDIKAVVRDARPVMQNANETLERIQETAQAFKDTAESFEGVGDGVNENLAHIEKLTKPLGEKGSELISTLETTARNADELIDQLTLLAKRVNSGQGTIGRVVTDDEIYEQVSRTLNNIEYLSKRLRPIVDDVRIITDKVSRDPGVITSGVLRQGMGGLKTGLKNR